MAEKKKETINPKNNDDRCCQYALTVALNYQNFEKNSHRISKIKPIINQYNWKEIDFLSEQKDWKNLNYKKKTIISTKI